MSRDALIVGINLYQHPQLQNLNAPAADAEAIAQRLQQDGDFRKLVRLPEAIAETNGVKTPVMAAAVPVPLSQLERELEKLFLPGSSQAPQTALFYFSGHGLPDNKGYDQGYLAASDTDPTKPRSGLSLHWLRWLLSESTVPQQIVWLDCCHSGSLIVNVGAANPGNSASQNRCFIASSRDFESSWEDLNSPYSVLTKALLEGLDPTRLPGRWIDSFALVDYLNQALKGELQTPVCTNFGEAINLTRRWQEAATEATADAADAGICPYKGLEFFDCNEEDPKYFFGRDALVSQLLDRVRTETFLALVGASGNGKSSVLRAGLLHQLKLGRRIAGSDGWRIYLTRPDRQPMQNLALAFVKEGLSDLERAEALGRAQALLNEGAAGLQRLVQASSAERVILVIDQFEEAFTRCTDRAERECFFACLMGALAASNNKLCLIIAMRADFIGKCLERDYSGLAQRIQQQLIAVLPLDEAGLKAAICQPAQQVGLTVEPALVTTMLNDLAGAPGSLPLLQYSLKALWQQRQNNCLTLDAYQTLGGIHGTLDRRATEIYHSFDTAEQQTVQHIFQQLTQLGEGTEDTRRRVFQTDLVAAPKHPAERVQQVINRLASPENRLLVTSEVQGKGQQSHRAIVDVAHEALIRHWTLLRQWIEQNRDRLRQQRKIEASALAWREQGQNPGYLLQGLPLTEALYFDQKQREIFPLSDAAKTFLQKSQQQRRHSRLKTASWLLIPALIVIGLVECNFREASVENNFQRLEIGSPYEQKKAVEDLVAGCWAKELLSLLPGYLNERVFGTCRPLHSTPLSKADLREANLSFADFRFANLRKANLGGANLLYAKLSFADLTYAKLSLADLRQADLRQAHLYDVDLSFADLTSAKLSSADLAYAKLDFTDYFCDVDLRQAHLYKAKFSFVDLCNADLHNADLQNAILLNTNLSKTKGLTHPQLEGKEPPLLCNAILPAGINLNSNRDCDRLAPVLQERYPDEFKTPEAAKAYVEECGKSVKNELRCAMWGVRVIERRGDGDDDEG